MKAAKNPVMTQQDIKTLHLKQIYLHCLHSGGISRAQLRREMGLSFPAVSALVDELIVGKYIEEVGIVGAVQRGRPSIQLRVCADRYAIPVVAMAINGYNCKIFNFAAEELESCYVPFGFQADNVVQKNGIRYPEMVSLADPLIHWINNAKKRYNFKSLVFSTPGSVNKEGVLSSSSHRISTPAGYFAYLQEKTDLELYSGNTADHYAYAEYHFNDHVEDFALILISNGVGSAVVRNGRIFETKPLRAGEFGHITIDYKGRPCICGSKGCLECYISTTAITEDAGLDFETLCSLYQEGDSRITALIREKADVLAIGLSNMLAMQPLKQIVIGGEIRKLGQQFLDDLQQSIQCNGFHKLMRDLKVRYSVDAEKPEMLGAVWNYIENLMPIYGLTE